MITVRNGIRDWRIKSGRREDESFIVVEARRVKKAKLSYSNLALMTPCEGLSISVA